MSLLNVGAVGAVLVWVLWRIEPRLDRVELSMNRLARAQMLTLIARPDVDDLVREQARDLLREMGHAEEIEFSPPRRRRAAES